MAKKSGIINQDQSAKSINGTANNESDMLCLKAIENGDTLRYIKKEPTYYETFTKDPDLQDPYTYIQFDQLFIAVNHDIKTVLAVHIDGTTTQRGERVGSKTTEGASLSDVVTQAENLILQNNPDLRGYKFEHAVVVTYPNVLSDKLDDIEKEKKAIRDFCIEVNYKIRRRNITTENKYGIDSAMKIGALCDALVELTNNPNDYVWCKDVLSHVWARQHQEYKYMPYPKLTKSAAIKYRDLLYYYLENEPSLYTVTKDIDPFLKTHGINIKSGILKSEKVELIKRILLDCYPKQTARPSV